MIAGIGVVISGISLEVGGDILVVSGVGALPGGVAIAVSGVTVLEGAALFAAGMGTVGGSAGNISKDLDDLRDNEGSASEEGSTSGSAAGGSESGSPTGLAQYGDDFGKMGTYVENPDIKVDWSQYAEHGFERMQQRGMTQEMVAQIVANGKVLSQSNGSKFAFVTRDGVAVVSKDGKLITTWSSEYYDSAMQEIIVKLFGE